MKIEFFEEFTPPKTTKQVSGRRSYDTGKVKLSKATWRAVLRGHTPKEPFQGALRLDLCLTFPQGGKSRQNASSVEPMAVRPDLDNLCKIILDAMTKENYWQDDSQVADLHIRKFKGPISGIAVRLATWEEVL